ncbi:MAG: hypothetical protein VW226_01730 [Rhodospirillaceae bacterium]
MTDGTSRIVEISESDLSEGQKKVFDDLLAGRGKLLTPYKIWIHSPELAAAMETIGTFLNKKSSLKEREVELVIVLIACHWGGSYVKAAHIKTCREIGYSEDVIEALEMGRKPNLSDQREDVIYDLCQISMASGSGSDLVYDRAVGLIGRDGLAEVLALLGYYSAVSIAMKLHRVPVPK